MKRPILLSLFVIGAAAAQAQTNGLIARWKFSGNANDTSGNGLHGTIVGAVPAAGYNNIPNTAMQFRGLNAGVNAYEHIDVPYNQLLNVRAYSICALIKVDAFYTGQCQQTSIFTRGMANTPEYYTMFMNDNGYDMDCSTPSPTKNNAYGEVGNISSTLSYYTTIPFLATNTWYCMVSTYDGSKLRMYIDGTIVHEDSYSVPMADGTGSIRIGASYSDATATSSYPYPLTGSIDDLRIYDRALTATEVAEFCTTSKQADPYVSVHDVVNDMEVAIAPNPASQQITVTLPAKNATGRIQLMNTTGQVVAQKEITSAATTFDLSAYGSGLYIIRVQSEGQTIQRKFIKE